MELHHPFPYRDNKLSTMKNVFIKTGAWEALETAMPWTLTSEFLLHASKNAPEQNSSQVWPNTYSFSVKETLIYSLVISYMNIMF